MILDRIRRRRSMLERELRARKPEPPGDLSEKIVRGVADTRHRQRPTPRLRIVVGFSLTVLLLVAMAVSGGVGYAMTAVADTTSTTIDSVKRAVTSEPAQTAPSSSSRSSGFAAALAVYPAPTLTCAFDWNGAAHNKFKIIGTTSVAVGTISVTVTESPDGPDYPATQSVAATASWMTDYFPNTTNGSTYSATVTQTAPGYDTATCTVSDTG